jgi:hypothetical protein
MDGSIGPLLVIVIGTGPIIARLKGSGLNLNSCFYRIIRRRTG